MFPIITEDIQKKFESTHADNTSMELPIICGFYGRACRQMGKAEGANRMLCNGCALAAYAKNYNIGGFVVCQK